MQGKGIEQVSPTQKNIGIMDRITEKLENIACFHNIPNKYIPQMNKFLGGDINVQTDTFDVAGFRQYLKETEEKRSKELALQRRKKNIPTVIR
jgi:hypothetical protein